jgi:hypothetical protein
MLSNKEIAAKRSRPNYPNDLPNSKRASMTANFEDTAEDREYDYIPNSKQDRSFIVGKRTEKKMAAGQVKDKHGPRKSALYLQFHHQPARLKDAMQNQLDDLKGMNIRLSVKSRKHKCKPNEPGDYEEALATEARPHRKSIKQSDFSGEGQDTEQTIIGDSETVNGLHLTKTEPASMKLFVSPLTGSE